MSRPVPSCHDRDTAYTLSWRSRGTVSGLRALVKFKKKLTLPEGGSRPAVLFALILLMGNLTSRRDNSVEVLLACPYIEKTSIMSEAPILALVPLFLKLDRKALVIVVSAVAKYFLVAIT
jgi:hypothetical protein